MRVFDVINEKINSKIENEDRKRHNHRNKKILNAQNIQGLSKCNKSEKNAVNEAKEPLG